MEDYGLLVSAGPSVKGLVPVLHASDLGTVKALSKYKVGQKVTGRVLEVQPSNRRMTMTLKPALLGSKFQPLATMQQAVVGAKAHGIVTGVKEYGLFLQFYGGLGGMAHASTLGLAPGAKVAEAFKLGQVVKAEVLAVEPATGRLKLGLAGKKAKSAAGGGEGDEAAAGGGGSGAGGFEAGDIGEAVVKSVAGDPAVGPKAVTYTVEVTRPGGGGGAVVARLEGAHLSDHPGGADALRAVLKPGSKLGEWVWGERGMDQGG